MAARRLALAAAASCHALRRALHDKLRAVELQLQLRACHRSLAGASSSTPASPAVAALGALLLICGAAAFPRAAAFFLPLVASTSLCCAAACLFAAEERAAAKEVAVEVVLVGGEGKAEAGLLQVIGEANASAYVDGVQVGCFLRRSAKQGVDEDGEEVVFAGTLAPCAAGAFGVGADAGGGQRRGALEEELLALRVDRLAEGVWDSYFGGWSRWHHIDAAVSCS
ncbi:hypothetical protein BDA96_03G116100 [Sorghum bicolor]|jgi:hypothetical protein|uniref:Uncharacterized protein n=2 Tax=Sorghum bicolor TaxID=4558 RepID=C5XFQ5_SORBI|nr:uncharacterized protein LOC8085071 [Sorghum bicolor]EES00486.1 hypothetical protein SORBI_3003G111600 [Sorghum bicolor]KAG0537069.1 hypothetical protein BDA96_03G116100 [Sorghum bicolor]|eukprot:XP_002455366.1 uncharacterized protein LOC8085071 [Sorghum bicolor]